MKLSNNQAMLLCGCMLGMTTILLQACTESAKYNLDRVCGNWVSIHGKPDVLIFKKGEQYKVTEFKKSGVTRKVKPETFLIVKEGDNLFVNTGFRIDIAYNEATDILTFSPNGDYTRASEK